MSDSFARTSAPRFAIFIVSESLFPVRSRRKCTPEEGGEAQFLRVLQKQPLCRDQHYRSVGWDAENTPKQFNASKLVSYLYNCPVLNDGVRVSASNFVSKCGRK